jgi:hypothetical protein
MHWILDLVFGLLTLVAVEALVKPLIRYVLNQKIRKYGPAVFNFLDKNMPELLLQYNGEQLNEIVKHKLQDVSGPRSITQRDLEILFKLYDPRVTANLHPHRS